MENDNNRFNARKLLRPNWSPALIGKSDAGENLDQMDGIERSVETIRYSILSLEFWISPEGQVREWLRHNTRLAVVLAVPVLLILPLITFALSQLLAWISMMVGISAKLIVLTVLGILILLAVKIAVTLIERR